MFVFAGIIILIVSFVVALISLVREQDKDEVEVEPKTAPHRPPVNSEDPLKQPVFESTQNVVANANQAWPSGPVTPEPERPKLEQFPLNERESFPTEERKREKSIEEIRAELAKIAGEKTAGRPQATSEPAPVIREPAISPAPNNTWAPPSQPANPQQGDVWVNPNR